LKARFDLAAGARSSRTVALLCCLLLVLAQIGAVTHALSHYRPAPAASAVGTIGSAANTDQDVDERATALFALPSASFPMRPCRGCWRWPLSRLQSQSWPRYRWRRRLRHRAAIARAHLPPFSLSDRSAAAARCMRALRIALASCRA